MLIKKKEKLNRKPNLLLNFLTNSFLFFAGTILSKAVTFFLLPVYSYLIPTQDMGIYDVSITIMTMISSICYFEIWSGVLRKCYDSKSLQEKTNTINSGLQIFLISSILFSIICYLVASLFNYKYKIWILTYMLSYMLTNFCSFSSRALGCNKRFAVSGIIASLVTVLFNILFLVVLKKDYSSLYISATIGYFVQAIFLLTTCGIYKSFKNIFVWNNKNLSILKFCAPLCLNTVAYWCMTSLNRVVFNSIYGDSASGVFAIGSKFGTLVTLITTCFNYAWQDLSFSKSSDKESANLYSKGCRLYMYFLITGFLVILPSLYFVSPLLIKGDYAEAIDLLPFFILAAIANGLSSFLGSTFYAISDTKSILITTIIGSIFNIIVSFPIISVFGADGVNIATLLSFIVMIILRFIILNRKISLKLDFEVTILFMVLIFVTCYVFKNSDWKANGILLICGIGSAVFLLTSLFKERAK